MLTFMAGVLVGGLLAMIVMSVMCAAGRASDCEDLPVHAMEVDDD